MGELARRSNTSDRQVHQLENGGTCDPDVTQRILDALASPATITSNTQANPTVITTSAVNEFQTSDTVTIAGNSGSNATINGSRVVTRVSTTTFSVPVNCTTAGGTGGTVTIDPASVTLARL